MTSPIQESNTQQTTPRVGRFVKRYLVDSALLAAVIALGLVLVELILASADEHWLGGTTRQWRETLQTALVYWGFVATVTYLLSIIMRIATRHEWIDDYVAVITAAIAGAALWAGISRYSPELLTIRHEAAVYGALTGFAVVAIALARITALRTALLAIQAVAIMLGAIAVLRYTSILLAMEDSRMELPAALALGWIAILAVITIVANLLFGRKHLSPRITAIIIVMAFTLPTVLIAIPKLRAANASPAQPNFLLVSADTLRADDCSVYGGPVAMPALESLANDGVVIDRFYTTAPWTVPSMSSMFSGRFPVSLTPGLSDDAREAEETTLHRLYSYWRGASGPTLAAGMRIRGYRTIAVVANPAMNAHQWLWQDFDHYQLVNAATNEAYGPYTQSPLFRNALNAIRPGTIQERPFDSTRRVVHYAETLLKTQSSDPFFLWVHFMDPHSPYDPPPALRNSHDRWSMFPPTAAESAAEPDWPYDMTDDEKAYARAQYRAETTYIDSAVGDVLDALRNSVAADSTYVCFLSDHGEEFWEHDRWGHGQTLFEEQLHVPFIISGPRIGKGRVADPVSAIDLAPTIADLLGLAENTGWHGRSMAAQLRNPSQSGDIRPIFAQSTQHAMYHDEPLQMVMDGHLKYVRSLESSFRGLYDIAEDPLEQTNLIGERPEDADRLHQMLDAWAGSFPSTVEQALGGTAVEVDPEVLETLKAIGYAAE